MLNKSTSTYRTPVGRRGIKLSGPRRTPSEGPLRSLAAGFFRLSVKGFGV